MRGKAHCYRKFWRKPLTIHKLGKGDVSVTFSKGLEIRLIVVWILFFLILICFRGFFNQYISGMFVLAFYFLVPYFLAKFICGMNIEGKRLDRFFLGLIRYLYNRKYSYSSGKAVYRKQLDKAQSYSEFKGAK